MSVSEGRRRLKMTLHAWKIMSLDLPGNLENFRPNNNTTIQPINIVV